LRRAPSWCFTWPSYMPKVTGAIQSPRDEIVDTAEVVASPRRSREEQADVFPSLTSSAGQRKFHDASPSLVGIATKQTLIPGMHLQGSRLLPPGKHDGSLVQLNESKTVQARPKI
jgi:hypothetical protein